MDAGAVRLRADDRPRRCLGRFFRRTESAAVPAHVQARRLVEQFGATEVLGGMYDRLLLVIANCPRASVVSCPEGEIEGSILELISSLEAFPPAGAERGAGD